MAQRSRKTAEARVAPEPPDLAYAVGGTALIATIIGNLAQHSENRELHNTVVALQRLLTDWQTAYQTLEAQLEMALSANQQLNHMVQSLRGDLRRAQAVAYAAEQRALNAEQENIRLKALQEEKKGAAQPAKEAP